MNALQERILAIFKEVSAVCERHEIPYYAIGGTAIGAVRHKGFIPWDDDLDIAVPIEHFERLQELLRQELPEYLRVFTGADIFRWTRSFIKVDDERTAFIENGIKNWPEAYRGVYIDIMPLSGAPDSFPSNVLFRYKLCFYQRMNTIKRWTIAANGALIKKITALLFKPLLVPFHYNYFSEKFMNELKKHPLSTSKFAGDVWVPSHLKRKTYP